MVLVSVLMPMRNVSTYVRPAVESILEQTFTDFEFIIVDDASDDDTLSVVEAIGDTRIRVLRNSERQGVSRSLNQALSEARGTLLARMDADDISHPNRLRCQIDYLSEHPEIAVVGANGYYMNAAGKVDGDLNLPTQPHAVGWEMLFGNSIAHPAVMMRAEPVRAVGGYPHRTTYAEDYDLWVSLSSRHQLANLPDRLITQRRHEQQITLANPTGRIRDADHVRARSLNALLQTELPISTAVAWGASARGEPINSSGEVWRVASLLSFAASTYVRRWCLASSQAADVYRGAAIRILTLVQLNGRRFPGLIPPLVARAIAQDRTVLQNRLRRRISDFRL